MQIITQTLTTPLTETAKLTGYVLDNTAEIDENRVRPAVVICPGGGYAFVSQREGQAIANQMNAIGLQAFVLDYSCTPTHFPAQLAELATAVKVIREHANEWHVDPKKIIAMGFSAGGHLAGSLATMWNQPVLKDLGFDPEEIRPNALAIGYPVITSGEKAHRGHSITCSVRTHPLSYWNRFHLKNRFQRTPRKHLCGRHTRIRRFRLITPLCLPKHCGTTGLTVSTTCSRMVRMG